MAWAIGIVSVAVFAWFVTVGRGDLTQSRVFSDVFDLQARGILQGRLSVPDGSLAFEGFVIDGQTYAYFGIFPSLIRLPVFVLTDRFDGELTAVSMLVAYAIALWAVVRVVERSRRLLRPDTPWTGTGLLSAGLLLVVAGAGSNLMFLASGAWVYHEAALWGAAGVLASFAATLRFLERPRLRTVAAAGAWAMVAWTSRGSVGLAPSIVLGLLGLAHLSGHRWLLVLVPPPERSGEGGTGLAAEPTEAQGSAAPGRGAAASTWPRDWRLGASLLVAAVAGVVIFGAVNTAKFGSPSALPFDKQVASASPWPSRRAALEAYDGSLFSARLIPSVAAQTFRPDLVGPTRTWPFVGFRGVQPPVWNGLVFDTVEPSAGLTVTSPFLLVLAAIGAVAVFRRRRPRDTVGSGGGRPMLLPASVLRPFLIGGVAAAYPPFTIAFIAQRYLADSLPLLIVAGAAGAVVLDDHARRRCDEGDQTARARPIAGRATLGTLALVSVVMTMAVTWSFQRFVSPPDRAARAAGVRTQVAVADVIGSPPEFERYAELPDRAPEPGLAVRGDCLGVYRGNADGGWDAIEVSARGGDHRLSFRLDGPSTRRPMAMLALGDEASNLVVAVVGDRSGARIQLVRNGVPGPLGTEVELGGGTHTVEIQADPTTAYVRVLVDGRSVLLETVGAPPTADATAARDPFGELAPFAGTVTIEPTPTPTCDRLLDVGG